MKIEKSALYTIIGIILLFSSAVIVTLIAPSLVDPSWKTPSSIYQVQMHDVADPNLYISSAPGTAGLQFVQHIKKDYTLLAFQETDLLHIIAPEELKRYITAPTDSNLKLTSQILLLRKPQKGDSAFDGEKIANELRSKLQSDWEEKNPQWQEAKLSKPDFTIQELFAPEGNDAFAIASPEIVLAYWVDSNYQILDETTMAPYHKDSGVVYVLNPQEYRISHYELGGVKSWKYDPNGKKIKDLEELTSHGLKFISRSEMIRKGEQIFANEGCWYCHTDQTRTLVQDLVLNGSESFPAPPSAANEYIYDHVTFTGTRRIGPDISRVGVKRPSRDWHKSHFWSPKTASRGSIMPSFQHFFDNDPRGTARNVMGVPNYKFEAVFQYLMTKGTRITPPTQAWWLGKDPLQTIKIIEGEKTIP